MSARRHNVVCISSIDWDFNWQGHQEVMAALAAEGHRVLFVENTGVRAARLSDLPRLKRRLLNWWRGTKGFRQERPNLYVFSPLLLPFPYLRLARWVNRALLGRALRRWCQAAHFERPVVWTFLPTRLVVDVIDGLDPSLVVYYCIADFDQLTAYPRAIARSERMLLDRADVVFVQGEDLYRRCLPHPNIHIFPFGVNMSIFDTRVAVAPELERLKRPIVGYVGGLHRHVDLPLLERVARGVDGTLVLVGPVQVNGSGGLDRLPNVVFAGPQPHPRVPEFVKGFDVGIVPYALSEYTRTVFPTKMNEYLAMGIPVVATDLPEIRKFRDAHGDVVEVASDAEGFVRAVRAAAVAPPQADAERRIATARRHGWSERISEMSAIVDAAFDAKAGTRERWDVALRRLYRDARRRTVPATAIVVAAFLLLFYTPALWIVASPLLVPAAPQPADAIVVFGGGVGETGQAGGSYQERVGEAVDLYRAGYARRVVFSSGFVNRFQEAEAMKSLAASQGVSPSDIVLETRASNTRDNVRFVRDIAARESWRRVLLVSSPYHMRRAVLTWRKLAPGIEAIAAPANSSRFYSHGFGASIEQIRAIAHEYAAIAYYWANGWI